MTYVRREFVSPSSIAAVGRSGLEWGPGMAHEFGGLGFTFTPGVRGASLSSGNFAAWTYANGRPRGGAAKQ